MNEQMDSCGRIFQTRQQGHFDTWPTCLKSTAVFMSWEYCCFCFALVEALSAVLCTFTNGLGKGYRAKMSTSKNGKQMAIQPAKSDQQLTRRWTIFGGCIAHDRSGNKRGVNVCKRSGLFQCGFQKGMCTETFPAGIKDLGVPDTLNVQTCCLIVISLYFWRLGILCLVTVESL